MSDRRLAQIALVVAVLAFVGLLLHIRPNPAGLPHGLTA